MKKLKTLVATLLLTVSLSAPAFAECELLAPGQIPTGPCGSSPVSTTDNPTVPGQIPTVPASDAVDVIGIAEAALWSLLLF